jgi:hypothetical protein
MLADVLRMTWFADIKMPLWLFVDKIGQVVMRALITQSGGFGLARFLPGAAFSGVKHTSPVLLALARHP